MPSKGRAVKMRSQGVDLSIYGRALLLLAKNPSILIFPLAAAVIDVVLGLLSSYTTDALGGLGSSIYSFIGQIVNLFALGCAIIQANNVARGYRASFRDAWEEAKRKAGGILLAAVGFIFIGQLGPYLAQILTIPYLGMVLQIITFYFLIFTIPAAAIGGLPGSLAISGSIRTVQANTISALILLVAFFAVFWGIPVLMVNVGSGLDPLVYSIVRTLAVAVGYAYVAFPFATTYDDINFKRW